MIPINRISQIVIVANNFGVRREMSILSKLVLLIRQISLLFWGTEENYERLLNIIIVPAEIQTSHTY
jgi:hypothetical protein